MTNGEWSITEVARLTGTTSRTLRHYDEIGLVPPTRVGANGYRHYDGAALVRLQRVLLLRELGLGLPAIAEVLRRPTSASEALEAHLEWLGDERRRLDRQIASVQKTIAAIEEGDDLMAEDMFDGFDHTTHKDEVEARWGQEAYASSDAWWRAKSPEERAAWQRASAELNSEWQDAAERGDDPAGETGQRLALRQYEWLSGIPGTPTAPGGGPSAAYLTGLGELYVADERFAANYGGVEGAGFVRDALAAFVRARGLA